MKKLKIIVEGEPMAGKTAMAELLYRLLSSFIHAKIENHDPDRANVKNESLGPRLIALHPEWEVEIHTRMANPPVPPAEEEEVK